MNFFRKIKGSVNGEIRIQNAFLTFTDGLFEVNEKMHFFRVAVDHLFTITSQSLDTMHFAEVSKGMKAHSKLYFWEFA